MRLLVIGGVAAGMSAAARARRIDPSLEIVVLEKGAAISWGACGIPYYLEGRLRRVEDLIAYTPDYFRRERNITARTGASVVSISHPRREVALEGGERARYDRLVIATGARPIRILPDAFTLDTLESAERLKQALSRKPRRALIAGAGYIGLEAADFLRRRGIDVEIADPAAYVLGREDAWLTDFVRKHLEKHGVALRLGCTADPSGFDIAISAAGIAPNAELAAEAGVELGRTGAIRVDDRMQTNVPGIWAAGDCAETNHIVTGRPVWIPLGTTANKMGRVAGANAAGARERFPGIVGTSIISVFGVALAFTGLSAEQARREGFSPVCARIEDISKPRYFQGRPVTVELVADRNTRHLIGGTVIGEQDAAGRINVIATALHNRMKVEDFEHADLAYAPPFSPVWDPVLIAAQQLAKLL